MNKPTLDSNFKNEINFTDSTAKNELNAQLSNSPDSDENTSPLLTPNPNPNPNSSSNSNNKKPQMAAALNDAQLNLLSPSNNNHKSSFFDGVSLLGQDGPHSSDNLLQS